MRSTGKKKIEIAKRAEDKSSAAETLGLSRGILYYAPAIPSRDEELVDQIKEVHRLHPAYGHKRIALALKVNHKRTQRVMRVYGIRPPRRQATNYYTTRSVSNHSYTNLIKEIDMGDIAPNLIWVSDLSYLKYQNQFYYLATIEDVATRRILGTQVGKHHDASLVLATIKQAIVASGGIFPTYFHTDQGKEFMASGTTEYLELQGVKVSVSDKGSPW